MKNLIFKAFSLVELLVVITILAIIWVVSVSINDWYKEKTYNTKVVTDLATIENSLIRYKQEKSYIPSPEGNLKYFTKDWLYAHDETDAFGYHWYITEKTIPKRYISVLPRDPRSNHYYAYWKTLTSWFFEVSWITWNNDKFESVVRWNYVGIDPLYNLIREYNGPDFVYDKSKKNFPYNPEEMIIDARIVAFTWQLTLNNSITDKDKILESKLLSWDNIKLSTWSTAIIYYSDWSYSDLWSNDWPLELTLSVMKYKKENNLFTRIRLALNYWTILTKASKMSSESNFDLYTTDTEASVRWTIFEMKRLQWDNKTYVKVIKWSIFLNMISIADYDNLLKLLKTDQEISPKYPISFPGYTDIVTIDWHQESILKEWGDFTILPWVPGPILPWCASDEHFETVWGCLKNVKQCNFYATDLVTVIWTWTMSRTYARWDCEATSCVSWYKIDVATKTCEFATKSWICSWPILPNFVKSTGDEFKQTYNWSVYVPDIKKRGYNEIECGLVCDTINGYARDWSSCKKGCPIWSHEEDNTCKPNVLLCSVVPNWSNTKTWNTTTKTRPSTCTLKCNPPYQISWNNCVLPMTKTANCWWSIPDKASSITPATYTQTCVWGNCNPILNWDNNKTTCWFKCNTNYSWNWSICKPATQTYKCQSKPPSNTEWNKVDQYIQTWNWSEWSPSNSNTKYDTSSSNTSCRYNCVSWANRNWTSCVKCSIWYIWDSSVKKCKITWKWCNQCPNWLYDNWARLTYCYKFMWIEKWNRRYKVCRGTNTICWLEYWNMLNNCRSIEPYNWTIYK